MESQRSGVALISEPGQLIGAVKGGPEEGWEEEQSFHSASDLQVKTLFNMEETCTLEGSLLILLVDPRIRSD